MKNREWSYVNGLSRQIIGAAIDVHRELGPGLLESSYEACLAYELQQLGLRVKRQQPVAILYKEVQIDQGYRLDLLVEDLIVVELKVVEKLTAVHEAQLLSYLKFSARPLGLMFNFNVKVLRHGMRRLIMSQNI
ncbi:MAG: GxxExxY protein [Anaerolineales bacterium]|nr:GxxExxY protein [Anaerolineales bacterium]